MIIIRYVWNFGKKESFYIRPAPRRVIAEKGREEMVRDSEKKNVPCWEVILCYRRSFVNRKPYFRGRRHGSRARIWCDGGATSVDHSSPTRFLPLPPYGRTARRTTLRPVFQFHRRDIHTDHNRIGLPDTTVQTIPFSGAAFR